MKDVRLGEAVLNGKVSWVVGGLWKPWHEFARRPAMVAAGALLHVPTEEKEEAAVGLRESDRGAWCGRGHMAGRSACAAALPSRAVPRGRDGQERGPAS